MEKIYLLQDETRLCEIEEFSSEPISSVPKLKLGLLGSYKDCGGDFCRFKVPEGVLVRNGTTEIHALEFEAKNQKKTIKIGLIIDMREITAVILPQ